MESEAKVNAMQQASQIKQQDMAFKQQMDQRDQQFKQAMAAHSADQDARHKQVLASLENAIQTHTANMRVAQDKQKFIQDTMHKEVDHRQKVTHQERMAAVKQKQASQKPPSNRK